MAATNIFKQHITQKELDTTLVEEVSAWQGLTKHHLSAAPQLSTSTQEDTPDHSQQEAAIQRQQSIFPYLDGNALKKYATKRSAVLDMHRRLAMERVEVLSQRRDSGLSIAGAAPAVKTDTGESFAAIYAEEDKGLDEAQLMERWKQRAAGFLLKSVFTRLGTGDEWKQYSPTTLLACSKMNDLLTEGDPLAGSQVLPAFRAQLKNVKWWFTRATDAVDFLTWLYIKDINFASPTVRLDVVKYVNAKGACTDPTHNWSLLSWSKWDMKPPEQPCGCIQYKRILQVLAAETGVPEPAEDRTLIITEMELRRKWQEVNVGAGFLVLKDCVADEGNQATELKFARSDLVLRVKFWRRGLENGGEVKGMRIEGELGRALI